MSFILKGLAGGLKGARLPLRDGMTLGRTGDIVIADSKSSSLHARILLSTDGQWVLQDNNSKNGTRIKGERIETAPLSAGVIFYIGDQGFEIIEVPDEDAAPPPKPTPPDRRYWYDLLAEFLERNLESFEDKHKPVSILNPSLMLEFVRGVQTNSTWNLCYGPRQPGSGSLDLPILEPGAPNICFEILPSSEGIVFKTAHPELVLLNGQQTANQVLRVGDTIRIHDTLIEVDFSE